jgi:SAM-dependent methyltransferase
VIGYAPELFELLAVAQETSFWYRARNRLVVALVGRHFPEAASLLEVGCGSGVVLAALHRARPELSLAGCDPFAEGLERAAVRVPGADLRRCTAAALPWNAEFDVVGAFDVLEHVDDDAEALAAMRLALRPGGGVVVLVPQHPRLWSEADRFAHHRRRYTRRTLVARLEEAGFVVDRVSSFVTSLLPAMLVSRALSGVRRGPYDPIAELLPPAPLNRLFERMLDAEAAAILHGVSLPVGGSLLAVGRRPGPP